MRRSETANTCVQCGRTFYPWYNRLDTKCCSSECAGLNKRRKTKFNCAFCGKESEKIPCEVKRNKDNFCSRECMYKKFSIDRRGSGVPWYKGGYLNGDGYKIITVDGKRRKEHVYIMEQLMGRRLYSYEVVHHDNEIKTDNDPKNLIVMPKSEHTKIHNARNKARGSLMGRPTKPVPKNLTEEELRQVRLRIESKYFNDDQN